MFSRHNSPLIFYFYLVKYTTCVLVKEGEDLMNAVLTKKTYTISEAAQVIGISRSLAFRLAKEGKLPSIKLATKRLIPIAVLERWLEESTKMPN